MRPEVGVSSSFVESWMDGRAAGRFCHPPVPKGEGPETPAGSVQFAE